MEVVELLLRLHTRRNSCNHRCVPGCRPYEEDAIVPVKSLESGASSNQVLAGGWPWNTWLQELWGSHRSLQGWRSQEKEAILQLARRMNQGCVCQAPSSFLIQVQGLPESSGKSDRGFSRTFLDPPCPSLFDSFAKPISSWFLWLTTRKALLRHESDLSSFSTTQCLCLREEAHRTYLIDWGRSKWDNTTWNTQNNV